MGVIIALVITAFLLTLGFVAGTVAEKNHFKRLDEREAVNRMTLQTQSKIFLSPTSGGKTPTMIHSETVIASDYFKNFLSAFRKFFGGEMKSYHSLMERGRRETLAKLIEQASGMGYNAVCNVRLEPADVSGAVTNPKNKSVMVCILGTATAYDSDVVTTAPPVKIEKPAEG
ncbi:YbjQ family protein [Mariniblastus fucicola]|uniref:Heavy-metal-binding n=1 Tax=Mariniblastus fucicola TaxID=980251 RepID=A0A5B9P706_9BACT|nr:heavy metal-binding domain-containing protein [Mariniblastus fucicola]QEG21329.1 hypothetical protein MFFC18_11850 [Mariniblastus fucicola]